MPTYDGIATDPGTGPAAVDVATMDIAGERAQVVIIDVGDGSAASPVRPSNPLPVKAMASDSTDAAELVQGIKTVSGAGAQEALVSAATLVEKVLIQACKGFNSANAGPVFIGIGGNDMNMLRLRPWETLTIGAPAGKKLDLQDIMIDVITAGDGVSFLSIN